MANALSNFKFHDGTITTGNGQEMNVSNFSEILEVEMNTVGTATVVGGVKQASVSAVPASFATLAEARTYINTLVTALVTSGAVVIV